MTSWFEGLTKDLSDQVSRAAASAQRLAEQAVDQAELQQLGERARASVLSGASALGLLSAEEAAAGGEASEEELSRCFVAEACTLKDAAAGGPSAADVEVTLKRWAARLDGPGAAGAVALRALLRSRALNIALVALVRSKAGRNTIRAAAGRGSEDGQGVAPGKNEAGPLRTVLGHASAAPPELLERLLGLLADAAKAAVKNRKAGGAGKEATEAEQDLQWVLELLSAALVDASELPVREVGGQAEALERSLAQASAAEAAAARPPAAAGAGGGGAPAEGSEAWAEWPGDGRWYHARVKSAAPGEEVEVEWMRPPDDVECGRDVEYLVTVVGEAALLVDPTAQLARLPASAVLPGGQDRPKPAVAVGEDGWLQQLDAAEALSRSFLDLKAFCEEFATSPQRPVGGEAAEKALAATTASLAALRAERRPLPLAPEPGSSTATGVPAEADGEGEPGAPERSGDNAEELRALAAELANEREQLLARLATLEQEQARIVAALARLERRAGSGVAGGEAPEAEAAGAAPAEKRARFLGEAGAASTELEALLASRTERAAAAGTLLADRLPDAAAACLRSERARRRRCEDLLSGLHAALWGPDAPALARNPEALASVRALITRAGALVEQAWREMVQLAAETLGDGGALRASSEEMSRAAKRYKEMRRELQANLDRIAKLEAGAQQPAAFVPPARAGAPSGQAAATTPERAQGATFSRAAAPASLPAVAAMGPTAAAAALEPKVMSPSPTVPESSQPPHAISRDQPAVCSDSPPTAGQPEPPAAAAGTEEPRAAAGGEGAAEGVGAEPQAMAGEPPAAAGKGEDEAPQSEGPAAPARLEDQGPDGVAAEAKDCGEAPKVEEETLKAVTPTKLEAVEDSGADGQPAVAGPDEVEAVKAVGETPVAACGGPGEPGATSPSKDGAPEAAAPTSVASEGP